MSATEAARFLERVEGDEVFAAEVKAISSDADALGAKARAAGFDTTAAEISDASNDRHGAELTAEQLDKIAAGLPGVVPVGRVIFGQPPQRPTPAVLPTPTLE